ncbi:MAG: DsrE family protein [Rhodocyclales bacterium]|nr:DsrE family protein [Rhodocyclales bacterium]
MIRRAFVQFVLAGTFLLSAAPAAMADQSKPNVLIQVSDGDTKTWNQALNVIRNVQAEYGKDKVNIELVVFGNGAGLLKFDSPLANRIDDTLASGATVAMCENTMKAQKLTRDDMHPKIGYVKAGIIEIVEKSRQGWTVVRP